ncbi:hypothetical protein M413DRAFT_442126 [Hebeloma cylindrosporum]|uniref:Uncharacterized protein n=1 Tax=Hebeloma cylindrosporum TaxID=76867 RepID=A0A0C3CNQ2_HEBCY|nr:hypothetical protein M413DRAFT_442126 [Hebeloma cylindrosporum h7]
MVTQTAQADVSFYFYGTGVQLYGAKRLNHGAYQISIDSVVYAPVNGSNGYHTVRMTNLESRYLDLDFITWQTPVGEANEPLIATTVQDTDASFKYIPEQQWNSSPVNAGMFSAGSGHVTSTAGASVEYTFKVSTGDSVAIYGPVGPSGAPYSVQLDNNAAKNFSSYKQFYRPQMILFQASNLGGGQHTVTLTSTAWNNSALTLAIDYAQAYTTSSLEKRRDFFGAIVGIAIGAVLLALLAFIVVFRRLWPSIFKNILHFKGRSNQNQLVTEAFEYRPISGNEPISSHGLAAPHAHGLTPQTSQSTFQPTPPSTSLWPISGGGSYRPSAYADSLMPGPNTQVITIPYTPDGKYRPDLVSAPQLMPPPQGLRRSGSINVQSSSTLQLPSSSQQPRAIRSQPNLAAALPAGARQPVPGASLDDLRGAAGREIVLAPLRREAPPPRYERDPSGGGGL